jgi:hypothetical protein
MKPILHLAILLPAVIAIALVADAWRTARRDSQKLAATIAAQSSLIHEAGDREKQRDSQLASALAAIQSEKHAVRTPQQAAHELSSVLPLLPLPVSIHDPNLSPPTPPEDPASTSISIPQPDLVPLYDDLQNCRATGLQNDSLNKDLTDEKTRSEALLKEKNAALAAARGGTFLSRLKRATKWFAIGIAAGAAISAATHH